MHILGIGKARDNIKKKKHLDTVGKDYQQIFWETVLIVTVTESKQSR